MPPLPSYDQIVDSIVSRARFGIRPGLDRIIPLLDSLGSPQDSFPSIHVVGTNGKGSTAAFLSSILSAAGYRTGFFSSPHLSSYTERFRVDGVEIPRDRLVTVASRVIRHALPDATFFELTTAIALLWFAEEGVDIAILEAGMGGRLDATNAVSGIMTLMTPLSRDHTTWLGGTLESIAREKIAILKRGTPLVSADQPEEIRSLLISAAVMNDSPLVMAGRDVSCWWEGETLAYRGIDRNFFALSPGIGGCYQSENLPVAIAAAEILSKNRFPCSDDAIREGVRSARWPGRMELFTGSPPILLDGAHNPAGARALAGDLSRRQHAPLVFVIGVVDDKDTEGIIAPLLSLAGQIVTVAPPVERGIGAEALAEFIRSRWSIDPIPACSVEDALDLGRRAAGEGGMLVVCGSLFLVGAVRGVLTNTPSLSVRG
ncbi:MAG: folylpolyglutamate synthase/dihydrofolate synthase family protein [Desulfuromonadia bacterium]